MTTECKTRQLAEERYESFESELDSQQKIREEAKDKPEELKRYKNKLHQATFDDDKAELSRKRGNKDKSIKFLNLRESRCEDALEVLEEISLLMQPHTYGSIAHWTLGVEVFS